MPAPAYAVPDNATGTPGEDPEHPLQAALEYARISRLYLAGHGRMDLAFIIDLAIEEMEREIGQPPPIH